MSQLRPALSSVSFWKSRFEEAQLAAGGIVAYDLTIGPCKIRLRLAGAALVTGLLVNFEPLLLPPSGEEPHLTIYLWDSASTGVLLGEDNPSFDEGVTGDDPIGLAYPCREQETRVVRALSASLREAWWMIPDAGDLHYYTRSSPLRDYLHLALRSLGILMLHAGVVGLPEGGVLLIGSSGSGKSTAALSCLDAGLAIVSEDYTALQSGSPPIAWSIFSSAKMNDDTLGWLPDLGSHIANPGHNAEEKHLIYLHQARPRQLLRSMPLKAIFAVGRSVDDETHLVRATRGETLRALAPNTILQLRAGGDVRQSEAAALAAQAQLVRQLPCYRLLTGPKLAAIPAAILSFLQTS